MRDKAEEVGRHRIIKEFEEVRARAQTLFGRQMETKGRPGAGSRMIRHASGRVT